MLIQKKKRHDGANLQTSGHNRPYSLPCRQTGSQPAGHQRGQRRHLFLQLHTNRRHEGKNVAKTAAQPVSVRYMRHTGFPQEIVISNSRESRRNHQRSRRWRTDAEFCIFRNRLYTQAFDYNKARKATVCRRKKAIKTPKTVNLAS